MMVAPSSFISRSSPVTRSSDPSTDSSTLSCEWTTPPTEKEKPVTPMNVSLKAPRSISSLPDLVNESRAPLFPKEIESFPSLKSVRETPVLNRVHVRRLLFLTFSRTRDQLRSISLRSPRTDLLDLETSDALPVVIEGAGNDDGDDIGPFSRK